MADTILIVEDEKDLLHGLERTIKMAIDCQVITAENGRIAMQYLSQNSVDLVLADIRMPEMDGITLLKEVKRIDPSITVVIMTGYGSIEDAVAAIKIGAYDFIQKPFDEERLLHLLKKGLELNRLVRENARLMQTVREKQPYANMVGQSRPMQQVFETIEMLAKTDVTVLILGETGTGKELAAKAIHARSIRGKHPLVTVNCPALPETILESELFGYQKGAFTNADKDTEGLFHLADGSTIFLDEIGDISASVQTKLLRFLQDKKIQPLGAGQSRYVDARIIAATNQDLNQKMEFDQFRKDLFYRLNVATLVMPPLKDIREDIPFLVDHFLKMIAKEQQSPPKQISQEMLNSLMARDWPGNIRELENTIRGWCALTVEDVICRIPTKETSIDPIISQEFRLDRSYKELKQEAIQAFTLDYLHQLLLKTNGNISLSAQMSGIKRQSLQKIIKRYQIDTSLYRRR
jgi:DNA-binding NtrC family response regulator